MALEYILHTPAAGRSHDGALLVFTLVSNDHDDDDDDDVDKDYQRL